MSILHLSHVHLPLACCTISVKLYKNWQIADGGGVHPSLEERRTDGVRVSSAVIKNSCLLHLSLSAKRNCY